MARVLLILTSFAVLAAWAGAQGGPPPLSAADRVKLFKTDRALIDQLVNHGIDLSKADDRLKQAQECQATARTLAVYLRRAAEDEKDPDRVAEMAGLLTDMVRDGLAPNLKAARETYPATSPQGKQVVQLGESAMKDLEDWAAIPAGTLGNSEKVKAAFEALAGLKASFK
ncbi:MAG TPA: hypothetical protein VLM40_17775 [Gemmata sp.]|nr:hypothetical protein [Gemmata sp.]